MLAGQAAQPQHIRRGDRRQPEPGAAGRVEGVGGQLHLRGLQPGGRGGEQLVLPGRHV